MADESRQQTDSIAKERMDKGAVMEQIAVREQRSSAKKQWRSDPLHTAEHCPILCRLTQFNAG